MSIHVNCSKCGALCNVDESLIGKQVKCGKCAEIFEVVDPNAAEADDDPLATVKMTASELEEMSFDGDSEDELDFDFDGAAADVLEEEADESATPELGSDPRPVHGIFRLDIGGSTTTGKVRDRNEDSYLIQQQVWCNLDGRKDLALVIVADGMGGHEAGDVASKLTINEVSKSLAPVLSNFYNSGGNSPESYQAPMAAAIKNANTTVHQTASSKKGMGSTAEVMVIHNGKVDIGHIGDCRVYHFHDGHVKQLTKDQTLVERMIDLGQLSRDEAKDHETRNEVTQAVGFRPEIQPAFYNLKLTPGDWLIAACDGLHAHVDLDMLTDTLMAAPSSAALVAHHLVDLANYHGGSDNCTVVAVRCY